jgi:hypothetical protein
VKSPTAAKVVLRFRLRECGQSNALTPSRPTARPDRRGESQLRRQTWTPSRKQPVMSAIASPVSSDVRLVVGGERLKGFICRTKAAYEHRAVDHGRWQRKGTLSPQTQQYCHSNPSKYPCSFRCISTAFCLARLASSIKVLFTSSADRCAGDQLN